MQRKSKKNQSVRDSSYRFGEFDLAPAERQLLRRDRPVSLAPKVFDALLLLVRNAERLVRREELIEALWPDTHVTDANLTNVIVALRKLLGHEAIETVSKVRLPVLHPRRRRARHPSIDVCDLPAGEGAGDPSFARLDGQGTRPLLAVRR